MTLPGMPVTVSPSQDCSLRGKRTALAFHAAILVKSGLLEKPEDAQKLVPPEKMTPERYTQIKQLAARVVAQADRGLTATRIA